MVSDPQTDSVRSDESPAETDAVSVAVVERLAAANGCDADALPPLFRSVDPDALERLVGGQSGDGGLSRVSFTHAGYEVTVTGDGDVTVSE